jgi:hypothetical protein
MKIQGKEDTIDNTQQSMDLEYYADGNDCCTDDFGMPEINKCNKNSGLELYANHGFVVVEGPGFIMPAVGVMLVLGCESAGVQIATTLTESSGFFYF